MNLPRLALIFDLLEEHWPSMDLVGDMLLENLQENHTSVIRPIRLRPRMVRRFSCLRPLAKRRAAFNADRLLNRFWDYPRWLRRRIAGFDLFHLVDHSYAQLVHQLPPERTVITCHDLDTFECVLEPEKDHRSKLFQAMTRYILSGFCKAVRIVCASAITRDRLIAHGLLPPERLTVVHNGVHPSCNPRSDPAADDGAARLLGRQDSHSIDILHVGSTIARKRIDILLRVFASLHTEFPEIRLLCVGGTFTHEQMRLKEQLELGNSVIVLPYLERSVLAAVYRRAALLLQPSEQEGFGLPVIEAMACGTVVVASDIPVLREVGGEAAVYCPVAEVPAWSETLSKLFLERREQPERWTERRAAGVAQAARFSWVEYARKMVEVYRELLC